MYFYSVRKVDVLMVGTIDAYKAFLKKEQSKEDEHENIPEKLKSTSRLDVMQNRIRFVKFILIFI